VTPCDFRPSRSSVEQILARPVRVGGQHVQLSRVGALTLWVDAGDGVQHDLRDLPCEERWHGVPDLHILLRSVTEKQIVIREGLKPGGLAYGEAAALRWIRVDEVVAVLRDVARDRARGLPGQLDPEAVVEHAAVPVAVVGAEREREIGRLGAVAAHGAEHRGE